MAVVKRIIYFSVLVSSVRCEDQHVAVMARPGMMVLTKYSDLTKYQKNTLMKTPQYNDCYPSLAPNLYSGKISKTENGDTCQRWADTTPHQHEFDGWSFNDGYLPYNYCRVDKGDTKRRGRPWCLTTNRDKEWDYCPVPSCHPNIGFCVTKMPGLDGFSSGIDLLEFDLYEIGAGRKNVVFEFTCFNDWKDVFEGELYTQPDQIGFYMQKDFGSLNNDAAIIKTVSDVTDSMAASISFSASYGPVSGALSSSFKEMEQIIKNRDYIIARTEGKEITAEARLAKASELPLNVDFKENMESLPESFEKNKEAYIKFIQKYGTHYITEALFGGMVRVESVVESAFLKTHTEKDLSVAASFQYDSIVSVSASAEYSQSEKKLNEDFKKTSKTSSVYYGGDVNFSKDGISEWQQSVKSNPVMTKVKLNEISDLFTDSEKKGQMESAIDYYLSGRFKCTDETWTLEKGRCYKLFKEKKSWQDADSHCQSLNSQLVSITDSDENAFVQKLCSKVVDNPEHNYYVDLNVEFAWLNLKKDDGTWVWADTSRPVLWSNWVNDKIPQNLNKNCGRMACVVLNESRRLLGRWTSDQCSNIHYKNNYVCEKPAAIRPN